MARLSVLVGLLAVGALASPAAAGPIRWSYSAEVTYGGNYGDDFRLIWADRTADVIATPGRDVTTSLFTTSVYPGPPRPGDASGKIEYNFSVKLTLTDTASGEFADLNYGGWYTSEWSLRFNDGTVPTWDWVHELSKFGNSVGRDTVELGGNLYSVGASGGGMGSSPNGSLVVTAGLKGSGGSQGPLPQQPPPQQPPPQGPQATPEPGTMVLAGLGLAGLAFARRVRRRVAKGT